MSVAIHATAVVAAGARLGTGVTVGPLACIEDGVEIGDGCWVGPHATILRHTTLGPRCRVHAGAVLGDLPQDLGFKGADTYVRIGADCVLREGVTVHRGTKPGSTTEIADHCFLMANSHCAHNVRLGERVILANGVLLAGYVEVGSGAFFGGGAAVHQFVRIGRLAMIGGLAAISKDVPPFATTASGAYNELAGLNVVGLRRAGFTPETRLALKKTYRTLFRSGLPLREAIAAVRAASSDAAVEEFCRFMETSARGVCRPARSASGEADAEPGNSAG